MTFDGEPAVVAIGDRLSEWTVTRMPRFNARGRLVWRNARKARASRVPKSEHERIVRRYLLTGISFRALGAEYEVTGEYIRQIVAGYNPAAYSTKRTRLEDEAAIRSAVQLETDFLVACQRAIDGNRICRACGSWILRGKAFVTCSPECRVAWVSLRLFDNHEEHRRQQALSVLAKPETYKPSVVSWAEQMLGPNPPPPNRRYFVPGSVMSETIRKYRPEAYAQIAGSEAAS